MQIYILILATARRRTGRLQQSANLQGALKLYRRRFQDLPALSQPYRAAILIPF